MDAVHRCGLLLQMSHVLWSVCLCVSHCMLCKCAKMAEPIEVPFGELAHVGPSDHVAKYGTSFPGS